MLDDAAVQYETQLVISINEPQPSHLKNVKANIKHE